MVLALFGIAVGWWFLRRTRSKHKNPKYVPTSFLKKLWEKWDPEPKHHRLPDQNEHLEPQRTTERTEPPPANFDAAIAAAATPLGTTNNTTAAGIDRNTSVRSVMTLPAYNPSARENEQVLGREGERGGIDVVIEFPEGADDEEERRDAEMEALYQIRLARRRENEEREERRRLRREARERGDYVALRELQARARAGSSTSTGRTVEELRAEHERAKKERQRAVSSVSYADLGVARHDGTRLRANSIDSEREGLLGDAASMASSRHQGRARSTSNVSNISNLSDNTMHSDFPSPGLPRSRASSPAPRTVSAQSNISRAASASSNHEGRAGSSPEMIEHDDFPSTAPPGYENISLETPSSRLRNEPPPQYASPVAGRGEYRNPFDSPRASLIDTRRGSATHVGNMISERRTSNSSSIATPTAARIGSPQLPSLRVSGLPSIHVNSPSPVVRMNEDQEHQTHSHV